MQLVVTHQRLAEDDVLPCQDVTNVRDLLEVLHDDE
jgi:hypothetical protein